MSVYALAMAVGGPVLTALLLRRPPRRAVVVLLAVFALGEALGAVAPGYGTLAAARLVTGAASGAFFGTALAIAVRLAEPARQARATAVVLAGIMVGTVLGLPLAHALGERAGWRASFWATTALAVVAAAACRAVLPALPPEGTALPWRSELAAFADGRLWAAFATSLLAIGATFAAFTYFIPLLRTVSGFGPNAVTVLLLAYGLATLAGNLVVGRLADRHAMPTLAVGLALLAAFLATLAAFADRQELAAIALLGIGCTGVTLNPALVTRVMRIANGRPLVNTVHTSVITLGILAGAGLGGLGIAGGWGLRAPAWIGCAMAIGGLATLRMR